MADKKQTTLDSVDDVIHGFKTNLLEKVKKRMEEDQKEKSNSGKLDDAGKKAAVDADKQNNTVSDDSENNGQQAKRDHVKIYMVIDTEVKMEELESVDKMDIFGKIMTEENFKEGATFLVSILKEQNDMMKIMLIIMFMLLLLLIVFKFITY